MAKQRCEEIFWTGGYVLRIRQDALEFWFQMLLTYAYENECMLNNCGYCWDFFLNMSTVELQR